MGNVQITGVTNCEECLRHFKPEETVVYALVDRIVVCVQCSNKTNRLRNQAVRLMVYHTGRCRV